ncbi:unnamed protein product [Arctia plantaginis]|uniref:Uncharacterized protein n=1 Tax=Arctia plantaginis TaxID=874455 RepID=A0A8S1BJ13_ARCPL|nr:unnamed protein product [Arctia plantaginis]
MMDSLKQEEYNSSLFVNLKMFHSIQLKICNGVIMYITCKKFGDYVTNRATRLVQQSTVNYASDVSAPSHQSVRCRQGSVVVDRGDVSITPTATIVKESTQTENTIAG